MKRARESSFVVTGLLGSGSYGEVYSIQDSESTKECAIKLFPEISAEPIKAFSDTIDYAREVFGCSRAGLLCGSLRTENRFGILMPRLGARLGNIHVPHYSIGQAAELLLPVVKSLQSTPGMHRDIKLANILLPHIEKEKTTLIDFSLATNLDKSNDDAVVTIWYRAPEVLLNLEYNYKIDVWALGIVLLNILTGTHLYKTPTENTKVQYCVDLLDTFGWPSEKDWPALYKELKFHYDSKIKQGNIKGHYNFVEMLMQGPAARQDRVLVAADLLSKMLNPFPNQRASWDEILAHPFWTFDTTVHVYAPSKVQPIKKLNPLTEKFFGSAILVSNENTTKTRVVDQKSRFMAMDYFIYYSYQLSYNLQTAYSAFLIWKLYLERGHTYSIQTISSALFLSACFNEDLRLTACNEEQTWKKWSLLFDDSKDPSTFMNCAMDMLLNIKTWPSNKIIDVFSKITSYSTNCSANKLMFLSTTEELNEPSLKQSDELLENLRNERIIEFVSIF